MEKTSHDISLEKDEKLKEKIALDQIHYELLQKITHIQYQIAELRVEQKKLEASKNQSDFNIKKINAELKLLDSAFWSARQGGL